MQPTSFVHQLMNRLLIEYPGSKHSNIHSTFPKFRRAQHLPIFSLKPVPHLLNQLQNQYFSTSSYSVLSAVSPDSPIQRFYSTADSNEVENEMEMEEDQSNNKNDNNNNSNPKKPTSYPKKKKIDQKAQAREKAKAAALKSAEDANKITEIREGQAIVLAKGNEVFYNPAQEVNRDLSVAMIKLFIEQLNKEKGLLGIHSYCSNCSIVFPNYCISHSFFVIYLL